MSRNRKNNLDGKKTFVVNVSVDTRVKKTRKTKILFKIEYLKCEKKIQLMTYFCEMKNKKQTRKFRKYFDFLCIPDEMREMNDE